MTKFKSCKKILKTFSVTFLIFSLFLFIKLFVRENSLNFNFFSLPLSVKFFYIFQIFVSVFLLVFLIFVLNESEKKVLPQKKSDFASYGTFKAYNFKENDSEDAFLEELEVLPSSLDDEDLIPLEECPEDEESGFSVQEDKKDSCEDTVLVSNIDLKSPDHNDEFQEECLIELNHVCDFKKPSEDISDNFSVEIPLPFKKN